MIGIVPRPINDREGDAALVAVVVAVAVAMENASSKYLVQNGVE